KGFSDAKARLEPVLSAENRASLAAFTAAGVLEAAEGVDTFVVCDNDEVAQWARERGAMVVRQHRAGLNGAVANGVDTATYKREWVLIAHSDLPFPEALLSVIDLNLVTTTVTIVPDRHLDGTNVLVVPAHCGFTTKKIEGPKPLDFQFSEPITYRLRAKLFSSLLCSLLATLLSRSFLRCLLRCLLGCLLCCLLSCLTLCWGLLSGLLALLCCHDFLLV
ncbi:MAG: hypothetical protein EBR53_06065, partial [Actinobacteria bacterium]|nr:hypothetical protein [Actinomycetota bacterium]